MVWGTLFQAWNYVHNVRWNYIEHTLRLVYAPVEYGSHYYGTEAWQSLLWTEAWQSLLWYGGVAVKLNPRGRGSGGPPLGPAASKGKPRHFVCIIIFSPWSLHLSVCVKLQVVPLSLSDLAPKVGTEEISLHGNTFGSKCHAVHNIQTGREICFCGGFCLFNHFAQAIPTQLLY